MWVIVLSAITLGVYAWFWWYFINRELRDLGRARGSTELGDNPMLSALAVSLGSLILVPPFVSLANTSKRVQAAQRLSGEREQLNGWIVLILTVIWVFGLTLLIPFVFGYIQSELNKVWRNEHLTDPLTPGLPHPGARAPLPHAVPPPPGAPAPATPAPATTSEAPTATEAPAAAQPPAPAPASPVVTPANWYPDPWGQTRLRYWDGRTWTGYTAD